MCCIKKISLSATASYTICLAPFGPDSKKDGLSLSRATSNDSLPSYLSVFISNYLSVIKLNFPLLFLLMFLFCSLDK